MDIVIGSSRAKYIGQDGKSLNVITWYRSGGRIVDMADLVDQHLFYNTPSVGPKDHMYIVCGICDVTRKLRDNTINYQEIVYDYDPSTNLIAMRNAYIDLVQYIYSRSIVPVLATVIPTHLETANSFLLSHNKTSKLVYQHMYPSMQEKIITVCNEINSFIVENNRSRGLHTPALHDTVMHNKKKGRKNFKYSDLFDGVHANSKLTRQMNHVIRMTIVNNRM